MSIPTLPQQGKPQKVFKSDGGRPWTGDQPRLTSWSPCMECVTTRFTLNLSLVQFSCRVHEAKVEAAIPITT